MSNAFGPLRRLSIIALSVAAVLAVSLAIGQDQQTLQIRSAVGSDDPRALAYIARLVGGGLSGGNSFRALSNGDEIFPAMLDAIAAARRRIVLETYIYRGGKIAEKFTSAFEAAARRGVDVSLVVDYFGSDSMSKDHVQRLWAAGCKVATFNESRWYTLEEVNYRTHRKILGDGDSLVVRSAPSGGSSDLKRLYLLAIALARRKIDIQSPYFILDSSGSWSLKEALARGVRVRILMESDMTDARPVKYSSRAGYEELLEAGAELYEYQPTMS